MNPQAPEPRWNVLWDEAACGLLLTDPDGLVLLANATFCRWTGMAREELVGKRRFQDLLTMGGRIFHQTHWAPLLRMQGSVAEVKLDLVRADGSRVPMVLNALRREDRGQVCHALSVFVAEDRHVYEQELLRARRRAEELLAQQTEVQRALALSETRLRLALEAADLSVWELDAATGERRFDPRVALLLGHPRPLAVDFAEFAACIDPAERKVAQERLARLLDGSSTSYRASYRLRGVDGIERTVLSTGFAVVTADGRVERVIGLLQDISELSRQQAAAEHRAAFAEQMVGIVSHDLRNPLSAISIAASVVQRAGLSPPFDRALLHISQSARRAERLIADLLDFTQARIGRGLPVRTAMIDLHAVVGACVAELASAHPARALDHRAEGEAGCIADADRLFQLIGNLVSNAMAYGDASAPVTVSSRTDAERAFIAVHNRGPEIQAAALPTLFEPMVRGATAGHGPGGAARSVGLGLYIVQQIARGHGGDVSVQSSAAEGTCFTVSFPRRPPAPPARRPDPLHAAEAAR